MINRIKVADAIHSLDHDPFTCSDLLTVMGEEHNKENDNRVRRILKDFENRKWVSNTTKLYFRTFMKEFRF